MMVNGADKSKVAEEMKLLLQRMIRVPSVSRDEKDVADILESFLMRKGLKVKRFVNNLVVIPDDYDPSAVTLMLNSHIDTVKPSASYTFDPFSGDRIDGKIIGLGSNDAGASVVSLTGAFLNSVNSGSSEIDEKVRPFNIILALSAEEEVGGEHGMRHLLPALAEEGVRIDMAIVGEPTGMRPAIAERGLVVLDCVTRGITGHAARNEGVNAIYNAIEDIGRIRGYRFPAVSEVLGDIKVSVTQIESGRQHNVVPDECRWVVDVRTTDAFTNEETARILSGVMSEWTTATPRSTRVRASVIDSTHPLVRSAVATGGETFVSPTTSDMSLMWDFPSLKIGPGESSRSHSADEYILENEIEEAIEKYGELLRELGKQLK